MATPVGLVVPVLVGALLLYSGSYKIMSPADISQAIWSLGVPKRMGSALARLLGLAEVALGVVVVVARGEVSAVLLILLGSGFAVAGLHARASGRKIPCNCFGNVARSGELGLRQVAQLPLWVLTAGTLMIGLGDSYTTGEARVVLLAFTVGLAALAATVQLLHSVAPVRTARLQFASGSLEE